MEEACENENGISLELEKYRMCLGNHKENNPGVSSRKGVVGSHKGWDGLGLRGPLSGQARKLGVARLWRLWGRR